MAIVFEIFPPFSRQDDKFAVHVMLERSEASFLHECIYYEIFRFAQDDK
jgi:hypothetical protein